MDGCGINASGNQMAHNLVRAMFGAGEYQAAINGLVIQASAQGQRQQCLLFSLIDENAILLDALGRGRLRRHFDPDRVLDEALAKIGNGLWHGGGEEQALAVFRQHGGNARQRLDETQIHHLVRFVENEDFHMAQGKSALLDQIEQAARRCHQNITTRHQLAGLLAGRQAAEDALDRKIEEFGITAHIVGNLRCQFAGWRKHQHPAAGRETPRGVLGQMVQGRQGEGSGFAGAGLRDTEEVAAFHQRRNGLRLDWRRVGIALVVQCAKDRFGKAELFKIRHK